MKDQNTIMRMYDSFKNVSKENLLVIVRNVMSRLGLKSTTAEKQKQLKEQL